MRPVALNRNSLQSQVNQRSRVYGQGEFYTPYTVRLFRRNVHCDIKLWRSNLHLLFIYSMVFYAVIKYILFIRRWQAL